MSESIPTNYFALHLSNIKYKYKLIEEYRNKQVFNETVGNVKCPLHLQHVLTLPWEI